MGDRLTGVRTPTLRRCPRRLLASLAVAAGLLAWPAAFAEAASFLVNDTRDIADPNVEDGRRDVDGIAAGDQCTPRGAIQQANALPGSHGIVMIGGTFSLTTAGRDEDAAATGDLDVTAQIAIVGQGPQTTRIHGGRDAGDVVDRVIDVRPGGSLTLSQLTVGLGTATPSGPAGGNGGGIRNAGGALTLNFVEVVGNTAREFNVGGTIVAGAGGGISNEAVAGAGGILNAANVTFINNRADTLGGAIFNTGTMTLTNVTVSGNFADNGAGISTLGLATLSFVTVAGNEAVDGVVGGLDVMSGAAVTIRGSIVTDSQDVDCRGRVTSGGSNVFGDDDDVNPCFAVLGPGDVGNVDLDLLDLQDNGGLVRTRSPKPGDPVGDGVVPGSAAAASCPTTDARGIARPQDGDGDGQARCDVGAHELRTFRVNATDDFPDLTPGDGNCDGNPGPAVQCFLRAAIQEANALPDPVVVLVPAGTFRLTRDGLNEEEAERGDLDLKKRIAVFGAGPSTTSVDGAGLDRVFDARPGSIVRLAGLRVTGGNVNLDGGGVRAMGFVRILDSVIDGNTAFFGGGLATRGSGGLSLARVTVRENTAHLDGGGVQLDSPGSVTVTESAILLNRAERSGGGIRVDEDASIFLQNVTVSGNRTPATSNGPGGAEGGGIAAVAGSLRLTNVTIAENRSDFQGFTGPGQGSRVVSPAQVRADNSIIGPNGLLFDGRRLGENCSGPVTSTGNNVGADLSCGLTATADTQGVDPGLAPLNANGGPSLTHALLIGRPAIDRVHVDQNLGLLCVTRDQRGLPRPVDGNGDGQPRCDSGAFEVQNRPCEPRPPVVVTVTQAGAGRVNVSLRPTVNEDTSLNGLRRVRFDPTTLATVDLGALGTTRGHRTVDVPLPGTFSFTVIPDAPGVRDLAPFVVFDDCGGWPSFAGAGPNLTGGAGSASVVSGDPGQTGRVAPVGGPPGGVGAPAPAVPSGPVGVAPSGGAVAAPATAGAASAKPPDDAAASPHATKRLRTRSTIEVLTSRAVAMAASFQDGPRWPSSAFRRMRACRWSRARASPVAIRRPSDARALSVSLTQYFLFIREHGESGTSRYWTAVTSITPSGARRGYSGGMRAVMLGRRRFLRGGLAVAGASLLAGCGAPLVPRQQAQAARVGILSLTTPAAGGSLLDALRGGLRDLGYVEGQTIILEPRFVEGRVERYPELVAELVRLGVSVIVVQDSTAVRVAAQVGGTIPIVIACGSEVPVERGLVASLARPGGTVTGVSCGAPELPAKRLQLLHDTVPGLARVAFIGGEPEPIEDNPKVAGVAAAARALGLALEVVSLRTPPDFAPREFEEVFAELTRKQVGAFVMDSSALAGSNRLQLGELAIRHRLPSIWGASQYKDAALLVYGANNPDTWRHSAAHIDKLLKGASPAELPMELPVAFDFIVNLKQARALGLTMPPAVLQQASEIIQ